MDVKKRGRRLPVFVMTGVCVATAAIVAAGGGVLPVVSSSLVLAGTAKTTAEQYIKGILYDEELFEQTPGAPQADTPEYTADNPPKENEPAAEYDNSDEIKAAEQAVLPDNRYPIEEFQFASHSTADNYFYYGAGCIRNSTYYSNDEMAAAIREDIGFEVKVGSDKPQVLVMHTHTTESFDRFDAGFYDITYPTRSTAPEENIIAVGKVLCETLNEKGICTVQATDYHDYPKYDNSYSRSAETVKEYLEKYPSIKVVLDIHRDGMEREDKTRVKPTVTINGKKAAQIMIISGADDGTMDMPNFRENLKFAARLQDITETLYPGFARPLYLAYRHYNQNLTTGSILVEVGSEANTLGEAKYSAEILADILASYFKSR